MPHGIGNEVYLGWMLLAAENSVHEHDTEQREALVTSRRANNYMKMRQLLEDPRNHYLDSTLVTMTVAGNAELRLGAIAAGEGHLSAVVRLLRERQGGIRALHQLEGISGVVISHVLHMTSVPGLFSNSAHVARSISTYESKLRQYHAWNLAIRASRSTNIYPSEIQTSFELLFSTQGAGISPDYFAIRLQVLSPTSYLGRFLNPAVVEASTSAQRCRAASLYLLNCTLYNLRHDEARALSFLKDVELTVRRSYTNLSTNTDGSGNTGNLNADNTSDIQISEDIFSANRHAALVSMLAYCARRVGAWNEQPGSSAPSAAIVIPTNFDVNSPVDPDEYTAPPLRTWESLEFVELIMFASPDMRQHVLGLLWLWLTVGEKESGRIREFGGSDFQMGLGLGREILGTWIRKQMRE
jgi:hypothetical protein